MRPILSCQNAKCNLNDVYRDEDDSTIRDRIRELFHQAVEVFNASQQNVDDEEKGVANYTLSTILYALGELLCSSRISLSCVASF